MRNSADGKLMMPLSDSLLQTLSTNFGSFSVCFKAASHATSKQASCFLVLCPAEKGFARFAYVLKLSGI